ncbi:hypothetical protein SNE25_11405 [Mucilaginibacter sabulilitoris]|uniref:Uncharacterized protein n=1 Tax=Mucilaginibacter sabulilitoris TaxID=1173583 RepID=A0ABZ0TTN1_9SPHI|nr:hypothetical protein [Mucilaginibacter sabulilitoris]WPU96126.1 hypothetical protein SNE25_11405 [Mucilaginibacter sabulilitoris]
MKLAKYIPGRLMIGFISLFFMTLLSRAPFETNPQDCEMTSVVQKKKKSGYITDGDNSSLLNV